MVVIGFLFAACTREYRDSVSSSQYENSETLENCTDRASFVKDVTIPDKTTLEPGEPFTKTWRVKNTGSCTWTEKYRLVFAMNTQMGATDSLPLRNTPSGKELNISVDMTAPDTTGSYRADFQLLDANNLPIPIDNGQYLWTIITVDMP